MVKINKLTDIDSIATSLAEFIVTQQNAVLSTKDSFSVAVSGGSMVNILAKALLENKSIDWSKWVIFFSDERLVPLDDEDSNYGAFNKTLLEPLAHKGTIGPKVVTIDESLLHLTDTANDSKIAEIYADEIPKDGIDLVLLGCGPDGHTCSLFPNHSLLNEDKLNVASLNDSPKPPPRRITLTLPYLKKCGTIAFVATGSSKKEVLKDIFADNSSLPCALVNKLPVHGGVCWFVDESAMD